jgi:hypothetical protein
MAVLAQRSGLSPRVLYYLRDGRQPSTATVQALMATFPELTFDELFVADDSTKRAEESTTVEVAA